jgi:hypothetical protein
MKLSKKFITWFNKNKSKDLYREVYNNNFDHRNECRVCSDVIYYYDSTFILTKSENLITKGKSFQSVKKIGNEYFLNVCEDCLSEKFPEYQSKNKSRVFNQMSDITAFAFNIPSEVKEKWINENVAITEINLIRKYGEIEGGERWKKYCEKQSYTNTLDYKNKKYGWDEKKFNDYNKSRSITLELMIQRHGENLGLIKWNDYLDKQKLTKSRNYVIDKYGKDFWEKLCKSKSHTIENYIKKYGDEKIANAKLEAFYSNLKSPSLVSKSSQTYFEGLDCFLGKKFKTYYYNKDGKEYGKNLGTRWVYLDYFISDLNLNIEYNGDLFHGNPELFGPDDEPIPFNNIKAKELWERDREKIELLYTNYGIRTIVIWESKLPKIEILLEEIKKYEN